MGVVTRTVTPRRDADFWLEGGRGNVRESGESGDLLLLCKGMAETRC